jgi:DNA-binding response OmpR family regulator
MDRPPQDPTGERPFSIFQVFHKMVASPRKTHTYQSLISRACPFDQARRLANIHACAIRKSLGPRKGIIVNVRLVGYRLKLPPERRRR